MRKAGRRNRSPRLRRSRSRGTARSNRARANRGRAPSSRLHVPSASSPANSSAPPRPCLSPGSDRPRGCASANPVQSWGANSGERSNFHQRHELGHLVLHAADFNPAEATEQPEHEREADQFAAHFLMPQASFVKEWEQAKGLPLYDRVLKVKRIHRVSYMTVLYRLHELGRPEIWALFKAQAKRRTGKPLLKTDEPAALDPGAFLGQAVEARKGDEPMQLSEYDFLMDRRQRLVRR